MKSNKLRLNIPLSDLGYTKNEYLIVSRFSLFLPTYRIERWYKQPSKAKKVLLECYTHSQLIDLIREELQSEGRIKISKFIEADDSSLPEVMRPIIHKVINKIEISVHS